MTNNLMEQTGLAIRTLPVIIYGLDPAEVEREAAGAYALAGVEIISRQLENRTRHYRNRAGVLLVSLDEVVRAIIADDLASPPAVIDRPAG